MSSENSTHRTRTADGELSDERDVRSATQPHQHDFQYDCGEEAHVTRREFCNFLAVTLTALFASAAGFAGKAVLDARETETFAPMKVEGAEGLAPGNALNFRYPTEKDTAILIRTAGFVVLATVMRPLGGWLSDRWGGVRVLLWVFSAIAGLGLLMGCAWIPTFTVGALGAAAALGLGNGAVFKLVPQYFPRETGTVTGLVGAFGGLGGFFPPLALGLIRDATGGYAWGFVFLSCFALACLLVHYFVLVRRERAPKAQSLPV
jgi:MFS family permease